MKKHRSKIGSIVISTSVVVFSLAAAFSGSIAWFNTTKAATVTAGSFQVVNNSLSLSSINLCKFTYHKEAQYIDYFHPKRGKVDVYSYNGTTFVDSQGVAQEMNTYDPVEVMLGGHLENQYCNVIYVVTLTSTVASTELRVYANHITKQKTQQSDIFLSDCLDFDLYTPADLAAVTGTTYYPSFIENPEDVDLTGNEEIYYKIRYLSSQQGARHVNFYGDNPKHDQISIHDENNIQTIYFQNGTATFYLNVNYSPSQLSQYSENLAGNDRKAIFDYYFSIGA